ncbi:MAG: tetratricopeptide repeat protein [Bacteroidia bacterium]|nr:tetratricopeptide repeat protein [Bacteroidia bacterium]
MSYQQKYQLVHSYLLQKDYEKAIPILQEVYDAAPDYWFDYYYEALIGTKKFSEADKLMNKQIKRTPYRSDLYVYWGYLYYLQNNEKKAQQYYEKAIQKLPNDINTIKLTANQFIKYQMIDNAMKVYEKGQKITDYPFYYEKAELFQQLKDYKSLMNVYLDILYSNPGELQNVQNQLQTLLAHNPNDTTQINQPILKQEIIKRLQKYPDNTIYTDLLIFLLVQQGDYEQAFTQIKSYDKRVSDEGLKMLQFCQTCAKNQKYDVAEKCYEEMIKKGKSNPFYESARLGYLQNKYLAIIQKPNVSKETVINLEKQIYQYIKENQNSGIIYPLIIHLADIESKYLGQFSRADSLLSAFIEKQQIKPDMKASLKLKLADVYILQNRLWEAILLCMQVEKEFKYEEIGQEAQYKRAKISFYSGEFKLAKSQADILKGATSKLIANDAMQLSVLISNALFNDSTGLPLKYFAKSELLIFQNKLDSAILVLDSINQKFTNHSLEDDIFYQKAKIYELKQDWKMAEQMYLNIINFYPQEMYADDAVYELAKLYQYQLNDKQKAMEYYLKLLNDYPGSLFVPDARKSYRILRGDEIN